MRSIRAEGKRTEDEEGQAENGDRLGDAELSSNALLGRGVNLRKRGKSARFD